MSARTDELRAALAKAEKQAKALRDELAREEKAHGLGVGGDTRCGRRWAVGLCCAHPQRTREKPLAHRYVAVLLEDYNDDGARVVLAMEDLQAMQVGLDAAESGQMDSGQLRELAGTVGLDGWPVSDGDSIPF